MIKIGLVLVGMLIVSSLTAPVYARNITAFIHINEEAIREDNHGGDLEDAGWTVDGKNYSSKFYDMSDAVYGDSNEPIDDVLRDGYSDELMVSDNATEICFEERYTEDPDYKVCSNIRFKSCSTCDEVNTDLTELHFIYPASWQPDPNEDWARAVYMSDLMMVKLTHSVSQEMMIA
jgi:hypothetical protein